MFLSGLVKMAGWIGLDLFNDDTCPSGHISRPTLVNVSQGCLNSLNNYSGLIILSTSGGYLKLINYIISDRRILLLAGIPLCKSQELSQREHSTSRLCSIHHDIPVTMHTPAAYGQWSVFDHSGGNQSAVLGTRYGIWWPWYGQFEVGWLQPLQLWLGAGTSLVAPVLVSKIEISTMYSYIPLGLNQLLNVGVDLWFHICIVDTCQWVYILVEGIFS